MATTSYIFSYLVLVLAGMSLAFQQVLNSNLQTQIGSPWMATAISYFVGLATALVMTVVLPGNKIIWALPKGGAWLSWTGGVFGAIFIATAIFMVPKHGVATTITFIVAGQMIGALLFDHFGVLGLQTNPIGLTKIIGVGFLVIGVALMSFAI